MTEGPSFEVDRGSTPEDGGGDTPWYRRTWVKYLAVFLAGAIAGAGLAGDTDTDQTPTMAQEAEELEAENRELQDQVESLQSEIQTLEQELEEQRASNDSTDDTNSGSDDGSTADTSSSEDETSTQDEGTDTTNDSAEGDFSDGTHRVGDDIQPDRYRAQPAGHCYWERLDGFSGEFEDIKANGNHDGYPVIVDVLEEDEGFKSENCGWWTRALDALKSPTEAREDGMWLVGDEMQPGEWQAPAGQYCYWERLSGFTHELEDIEANGNPRDTVIVEIQDSDEGFHASGCGTWDYLS